MDPNANVQAIFSVVRSVLVAIGGWMTAKGWLDANSVASMVGWIMMIAPAIWGVYQKFQAQRVLVTNQAVAMNVGIIKADATVGQTPPVTKEEAKASMRVHGEAGAAMVTGGRM